MNLGGDVVWVAALGLWLVLLWTASAVIVVSADDSVVVVPIGKEDFEDGTVSGSSLAGAEDDGLPLLGDDVSLLSQIVAFKVVVVVVVETVGAGGWDVAVLGRLYCRGGM